jgi:DNA processing protein
MLPEIDNDLIYKIALTQIKDIGSKKARALVTHFGSIQNIYNASPKELKQVPGFNGKLRQVKDDEALEIAAKEVDYIKKHNIIPLWIQDEAYPDRLKQCLDAPVMLYYKGNANLNAAKMVAVIGTRINTDYGDRMCEELINGLSALDDIIIVSGLAYGIDTLAHKYALKNSLQTVGVVGHGLDRVYPSSNKQLANDMVQHGGIISEFISGTKADSRHFPMRNRIVAGVCDVTVVVESAIDGGGLITARVAASYNREVAAYPGRVIDSRSAGCNELIRTNTAAMVTCAEDLIELMNWKGGSKPKAVQKQLFIELTEDERKVVDILQQKESVHADELYHATGIAASQLAATLLQLEMQGIVKALPGKQYRMN